MKRLLTYRNRAHLACARALLSLLRIVPPDGYNLTLIAVGGRVVVHTTPEGPGAAACRSGLSVPPAPAPSACEADCAAWLAEVEANVLYSAGIGGQAGRVV